jgi:hypothetical protein
MKRLLLTPALVVGIAAAMAGPALAAPTLNDKNCAGVILAQNTPEDFHHGEEAKRAVPGAQDGGRGDDITPFTSVFAGCKGL